MAQVVEVKKAKQFEILDEDKRIIAGWASVEIVDSHGDIIPIEELKRGMLALMDRGGHILYGHSNKPVGKILAWEIKKHPEVNADGLWIVARLYNEYPLDNEVWEMVKRGILKGFSIGAQGRKEKMLLKDKSRTDLPQEINVVRDLNLMEISIVPTPANPLATIEAVNYIAKSLDGEKDEKKITMDEVLAKYGLRKADIELLEGCPICEEAKRIIKEVGDVDLGLRIWRALELKKKRWEEINGVAENVEKAIHGLRDFEHKLVKKLAEEREKVWMPADEFAQLLKKNLEEVKKVLEEIQKPFGRWRSFYDCVGDMRRQGYSQESANRICGSLKARLEKAHLPLEEACEHIDMAINALSMAEKMGADVRDEIENLQEAKERIEEMVEEETEGSTTESGGGDLMRIATREGE